MNVHTILNAKKKTYFLFQTAPDEYMEVVNYFENTRPAKDSSWTINIQKIFSLEKEGEERNFLKSYSNKTLLWYGARITNYAKILFQGFKFQPKCHDSVYKYGRGLSFYDMVSSAATFCYANENMKEGYIMLCEVALGNITTIVEGRNEVMYFPKDCTR